MTDLVLHLRLVGLFLTCLGIAHIWMPRYFRWKEELASITPFTREVHFVHHAYIGVTVFLQGLLFLFLADDFFAPSRLALAVSVGLGCFWGSRLIVQVFVYSPTTWRGKRFETAAHVFFCLAWTYVTVVLFGVSWHQLALRSG